MSSKLGYKILALICILTIPLLLGKAPVVYAFPGADLPPVECPGGIIRITGPAVVGTMLITYNGVSTKGDIRFTGRCKNEILTNEDFGATGLYNNLASFNAETAENIEGTHLAFDLGGRVVCEPQGGQGVINTVTTFNNDGTGTMVVGVVILWEVCVIR